MAVEAVASVGTEAEASIAAALTVEASMADLMAEASMAADLMAAHGLLAEEVATRAAAFAVRLVVSEQMAVPTAGPLHRAA